MHNQAFDYVKQAMERKTLHIRDDWGHTRKGQSHMAQQTANTCKELLDMLRAAGIPVNNV